MQAAVVATAVAGIDADADAAAAVCLPMSPCGVCPALPARIAVAAAAPAWALLTKDIPGAADKQHTQHKYLMLLLLLLMLLVLPLLLLALLLLLLLLVLLLLLLF